MAAITVRPHESEAELIARVIEGSLESLYELMLPYERSVFLIACSILDTETEVEEVSQEAVLKAFLDIAKFPAGSSFRTWVVQITISEAHMWLTTHPPQSDWADIDSEYARDLTDWREIPLQALQEKEL